MKKNYFLLLMISYLFLNVSVQGQALSGTYTIGGTTPDYATIAAAVSDLNIKGISASVVFEIRPGTYTEQVRIEEITGAGKNKTITFTSSTGDSTAVIMKFSSTGTSSNYLVMLDSAKYITFKKMTFQSDGTTYRTIFEYRNGAKCITITNNIIKNLSTFSSSENAALIHNNQNSIGKLPNCDSIYIQKNIIYNEGQAVYILPYMTGGARAYYINIENNKFENTYLNLDGVRYLKCKNNNFVANLGAYNVTALNVYGYAPMDISNNTINFKTTGEAYGININNTSQLIAGQEILVYNNMVHITASSQSFGIYTVNCGNIKFYHNTVLMEGSANSQCFRESSHYSNTGPINILNNIFINNGDGYAFVAYQSGSGYTPSKYINNLNYNDYVTTGTVLALWGTTDAADLTALKTLNSKDANSVSKTVSYYGTNDLHLSGSSITDIDLVGTILTEVTTDIDGDKRSPTKPFKGADEGDICPNGALSGIFTIGTSGDYATINAAITDMITCGIDGIVTFNLKTGIYTEQIVIPPIEGTSETDTIVFQSETGDTADVDITFQPVSSSAPYTIKLDGAKYISFKDITLTVGSSQSYGNVVCFDKGLKRINFIDCHFLGSTGTASPFDAKTVIDADNSSVSDSLVVFHNNVFKNSKGAFRWAKPRQCRISKNTFLNSSIALYITYADKTIIENNVLDAGLNFYYTLNSMDNIIRNNTFFEQLDCYSLQAVSGHENMVYNNFFKSRIVLRGCNYIKVNNNSVISDNNAFITMNTGTNYIIKNNIFKSTSTIEPVISLANTTDIKTLDYNDVIGTVLYKVDATVYPTQSEFQTATGMETHSISKAVDFVNESTGDLHILCKHNAWIVAPIINDIPIDIDGETRPATTNMGADEFTEVAFDITTTAIDFCPGPSYTFEVPVMGSGAITWKNESGTVLGNAATQAVIFSSIGSKKIIALWSDGDCNTSDTMTVIVDYCTSIEPVATEVAGLYPNPCNGVVYLTGIPQGAVVSINDMTGRNMYSSTMELTSATINTGDFKPGVYFIKILQKESVSVFKLIKE